MKLHLKTAVVLGVICAVSAALLSFVNSITSSRIDENEKLLFNQALEKVASDAMTGEKVDVVENKYVDYFYPLYKNKILSGYVIGLKNQGYGGLITLVAAYNLSGTVESAVIVSNSETPGVGKKAENENYMNLFIGKGSASVIPTNKNQLSDVDKTLVSGATITFSSISKALSEGSAFVKELEKKL